MHYVIGDLHGCIKKALVLIEYVERTDKEAKFVFVGDFLDKNPCYETIQWCTENITENGKYQAVVGNHEMDLKWFFDRYPKERKINRKAPETLVEEYICKWTYGHGIKTGGDLTPYVRFIEGLPFCKTIKIKTVYGSTITYIIAHAFAPNDGTGDLLDERQKECIYTLDRSHCKAEGYAGENILVHGHTPTGTSLYTGGVKGRTFQKKLIGYRHNCINVDGGAGMSREAFLCAICLENLEEIYVGRDLVPQRNIRDESKADFNLVCRNEILDKMGKQLP